MNSYAALTYSGSFIFSSISLQTFMACSKRLFLDLIIRLFFIITPYIISVERYLKSFKTLLGSLSDELTHSSPKLRVFHVPLVLLPYIFFIHNKYNVHANIKNQCSETSGVKP